MNKLTLISCGLNTARLLKYVFDQFSILCMKGLKTDMYIGKTLVQSQQ